MSKKLTPVALLLALAISPVTKAQELKFAQVSEAELTKDSKDGTICRDLSETVTRLMCITWSAQKRKEFN